MPRRGPKITKESYADAQAKLAQKKPKYVRAAVAAMREHMNEDTDEHEAAQLCEKHFQAL